MKLSLKKSTEAGSEKQAALNAEQIEMESKIYHDK